MKTVSEVERQRTFRYIDDVALRSINKNFVGEEIKAEFFNIDFFASAKLGSGFLELSNPEKISWEMLNLASFVIFGKLLFIIVETSGETTFGVFVHFMGSNLELNNAFVLSNNGGVERLITVLLRHGDIIFDAARHWHIEGMNDAERKIAVGDIIDDNTEGGKVVDFAHVLIVFSEFFVEGIDGFDSTRYLEFNFFAAESFGNFFLYFLHGFFGGNIVFFDSVGKLTVALRIDIRKSNIGHFDTKTAHIKTIGKGSKNF